MRATYTVYNASWQPFYKVNVPRELGRAEIIMFAKITQKTGEDWNGVRLTLSNVVPFRGVRLPGVDTWYILPETGLKRMRSKALLKLSEREAKAPEAGVVLAERERLPLSFEYSFPRRLNVESRDKETIVSVWRKELRGDFYYYSVPRVSRVCFLVMEAKADEELLGGYLHVYFEGRFLGKTYLEEKRAGEKFYLNLGVARFLKVKREKIKDKIRETFFRKIERKIIVRDIEYKVTLENMGDKAVRVRLLDNIPVSRSDRIQVEKVELIPEPKERNYGGKEGVNLWELRLKGGETQEVTIRFTLTYPKEMRIYGIW